MTMTPNQPSAFLFLTGDDGREKKSGGEHKGERKEQNTGGEVNRKRMAQVR